MMRRVYHDLDDSDFAVAIAASANAIHSLQESRSHNQITNTNTRKEVPFRPVQTGSIRRPSRNDTRPSSGIIASFSEEQRKKETNSWGGGRNSNSNSKADAWERAQISKIRKRYEKMQSEIVAWENEKKLRQKHQMERRKNELELRKSRNLKHYESKISRIDRIGYGARTQVEEKRKQEEYIVKEKARKMRLTGKAPQVYCFCF
ncbi:hypothetical protein ACJIZ3_020787 [Penstemon smallii]|uniref:Remorin C-terminal domain-containing protein n=1 Tax=Penstemon smallii TaxID=265156 RepID=A0ABD3SKG2_9LAMI